MNTPDRPLKIIIVDDSADDQFFLKNALSSFKQLKFESFSYPEKFLSYLNQLSERDLPHIVIIDINMPRMTGFEVIETICNKPLYKSIKFFILSTSITDRDKAHCDRLKLDCFIKPVGVNDFKKVVERIVAEWETTNV